MKITLRILSYLALFLSSSLFAVNDNAITGTEFPTSLSEFGFFINPSKQIPSKNVHPYELITSLFSDYSYKKRFVYTPEGEKGIYQKDQAFNFPVGSALIKTFYYPQDERNLELGLRLLETRVL